MIWGVLSSWNFWIGIMVGSYYVSSNSKEKECNCDEDDD
jgi:hypothetical protein